MTRVDLLATTLATTVAIAAADAGVTVHPADTGVALENPGMGWTLHYYSNVPTNYGSRLAPSDTVDDFPGLTTVYLRLPWGLLEPEEGVFNWSVLDGPAQRFISKGKRIALRLTCSESWMEWATPRWVMDAGAKGYRFRPGPGVEENGPFWEPDYNDPVFLEKLDHFLAAAAARYDGSPNVAFIDVGTFGVWGEGHTFSSTQLKYPAETVQRHIDLHLKHFRQTLLVANDDFSFQGDGTMQYALDAGLGFRDDSIMVQPAPNAYMSTRFAEMFWRTKPVILECEHFGPSKDRGAWQDGSLYVQCMEDYHASYAAIHWWPHEFLEANRAAIDRMNLRLGYRLQPVEVSWPESVAIEGPIEVRALWRNAGVAPCLPGGFPAITLKDADGGIVTVLADERFDMRDLPVGPPGEAPTVEQRATFRLPFYVRGGTYDVLLSVGDRQGTPTIALPLADGDAQRRYRLGQVTVRGQYSVTVGAPVRDGDSWLLPTTWTIHEALPGGIAPFAHFDPHGADGPIQFQAVPAEGANLSALSQPATVDVPMRFTVPAEMRGHEFDLHVGLWRPERLAQPDERLTPDSGGADRRVAVGTVRVGQDGSVEAVGWPNR